MREVSRLDEHRINYPLVMGSIDELLQESQAAENPFEGLEYAQIAYKRAVEAQHQKLAGRAALWAIIHTTVIGEHFPSDVREMWVERLDALL